MSVCGSWLCFGRLDPPKKPRSISGAFGLVFLPLASYLFFGTVLKSARQQPEFGLSGFACHAKSKSAGLFCCLALLDPRLEARGTASALARGRSCVWSAMRKATKRERLLQHQSPGGAAIRTHTHKNAEILRSTHICLHDTQNETGGRTSEREFARRGTCGQRVGC